MMDYPDSDEDYFGKEEEEEQADVPDEPAAAEPAQTSKRYERLLKETRKLSKLRGNDHQLAQKQYANPEQPLAPKAPKTVPRLRRSHCTLMDTSIGFDSEDAMLRRLQDSKKDSFKVDRELTLRHVRYVPFGPEQFYRDVEAFYSNPTDLCCQWCTEPFSTLPVGLPVRMRQNSRVPGDYYFTVSGQFCGPSCMLAKAKKRCTSLGVARLFLKRVYGLSMKLDIEPAPDPMSLRKFGGMYTIEQFRATGATAITTAPVQMPMVPESAGITEVERTVTVVSEVGGRELARKHIRNRPNLGINMALMQAPAKRQRGTKQVGRFKTAPSIDEQIRVSESRTEAQMKRLEDDISGSKKKSIMSYLKVKSSTV